MRHVLVADLPSHFGDAEAGVFQQGFGFIQAVRADKIGGRSIAHCLHFSEELRTTHAEIFAKLRQGEIRG